MEIIGENDVIYVAFVVKRKECLMAFLMLAIVNIQRNETKYGSQGVRMSTIG